MERRKRIEKWIYHYRDGRYLVHSGFKYLGIHATLEEARIVRDQFCNQPKPDVHINLWDHFDQIYKIMKHEIAKYISFAHRDLHDLTMDSFERAMTYIHSYNPNKGSLVTWCARIARNHVFKHFMKPEGVEQNPESDLWNSLVDNVQEIDRSNTLHRLEKIGIKTTESSLEDSYQAEMIVNNYRKEKKEFKRMETVAKRIEERFKESNEEEESTRKIEPYIFRLKSRKKKRYLLMISNKRVKFCKTYSTLEEAKEQKQKLYSDYNRKISGDESKDEMAGSKGVGC